MCVSPELWTCFSLRKSGVLFIWRDPRNADDLGDAPAANESPLGFTFPVFWKTPGLTA